MSRNEDRSIQLRSISELDIFLALEEILAVGDALGYTLENYLAHMHESSIDNDGSDSSINAQPPRLFDPKTAKSQVLGPTDFKKQDIKGNGSVGVSGARMKPVSPIIKKKSDDEKSTNDVPFIQVSGDIGSTLAQKETGTSLNMTPESEKVSSGNASKLVSASTQTLTSKRAKRKKPRDSSNLPPPVPTSGVLAKVKKNRKSTNLPASVPPLFPPPHQGERSDLGYFTPIFTTYFQRQDNLQYAKKIRDQLD